MRTVESELGLPKPITHDGHDFILGIMLAARTLSTEGQKRVRGAGLTEAQFNVLMMLKYQFNEGVSQTDLSKRILVHRANVTGLVDRLERDGLVTRERRSDDRRTNTVKLTDAGRKKLSEAEGPYFGAVSAVADTIPDAERAAALDVLLKICGVFAHCAEGGKVGDSQ